MDRNIKRRKRFLHSDEIGIPVRTQSRWKRHDHDDGNVNENGGHDEEVGHDVGHDVGIIPLADGAPTNVDEYVTVTEPSTRSTGLDMLDEHEELSHEVRFSDGSVHVDVFAEPDPRFEMLADDNQHLLVNDDSDEELGRYNEEERDNDDNPHSDAGDDSEEEIGGYNNQDEDDNGVPYENDMDMVDEPLYPGAAITKMQSQVLLLRYIFKHGVSGEQLEDMCKLFNAHVPNIIPKSKFLFKKNVPIHLGYKFHLYCDNCQALLEDENEGECDQCHTRYEKSVSLRKENFFITCPLKDQLQDVLENHNVTLIKKSDVCANSNYTDITSGMKIRNHMALGEIDDSDFTILWDLDGAQAFKSSTMSYWPFLATVNELCYEDRMKHILMPGLWFGKGKPNMRTFLSPIVQEADLLSENGFDWRNAAGNIVHSRVFYTTSTCDAVAQPVIRNSTQFNGYYGCAKCYHKGERVEKGGGSVMCYPFLHPEPEERSNLSHLEDSNEAVSSGVVFRGVKGPSPLMLLSHFDMVDGFTVDYMHCVLIGVIKQLVGLWFDSCNHDQPWYIGLRVADVDRNLLSYKPPSEITRTPRSISSRKFWKASEWRSFLLYYAMFSLNGILPDEYLRHLKLLSWAIYVLLQDSIKREEVNIAEYALKKFVIYTNNLYGPQHVSYNIHQLCHVPNAVRNWGPLWATSAFPFEGMNHVLLKMKHGTQHTARQIAEQFVCKRSVEVMANACMVGASADVLFLNRKLAHIGGYMCKNYKTLGTLKIYGKPKSQELEMVDRLAIQRRFQTEIDQDVVVDCYSRFSAKHVMCCSSDYKHGSSNKRSNHVIQLTNGGIYIVKMLVAVKLYCHCDINDDEVCQCPLNPVLLVKRCTESGTPYFVDRQLGLKSTHIHKLTETNATDAVDPDQLHKKCVLLQNVTGEETFAVPLPNRMETD